MSTIEVLKELVTAGLYFDDHTQIFTAYRSISKQDRDALLALIEAEQARQSAGNNESICAICFHHAPFNITEPCMSECHGNSHFLSKTSQTDWQHLFRLKEVEREGTQNALDDARRKISELQIDLERAEMDCIKADAQSTRHLPVPQTDDEVQRAINWIENYRICWALSETNIAVLDTIKAALSAYRKPSAGQEEIDRAIVTQMRYRDDAVYTEKYHRANPHEQDAADFCLMLIQHIDLAITALRRMAGEGK